MGNNGNSGRLYFLGSKITSDGDCSHENQKTLAPWNKSYDQPRHHIKKQRYYFANKSPSSQGNGFKKAVQFSSVAQLCTTLCDPMTHSTPVLPVHHQLPEFTQTHVHWISDAIQPSHPLCPLLLLPSIFPSVRVFSNESALGIRWPKYWSFSFNINPFNVYLGLISFRMDWLDLLAVQGTLKSLLQHHSSKASILRHCFLYGPTLTSIHDHWKNHSLD